MDLIASTCAVPGDLRLVPAGAHVAPPSPPGRGPVDEQVAAARIGADPEPRRRVIGQELGERAGDGGACLVEPVADLGERVPRPVRVALDLVVVQPVPKDVIEVAQLVGGRVAALRHLLRDLMQELA